MSLREEVKVLSGNKRRFFLLRIADIDTKAALTICGVKRGTYNSWLQHSEFVDLYRRRDEFAGEYKQEAIKLLRRDNQLEAVLLEGRIVAKIKEELANGEYDLIRTNMAKEVYSKLISDLDIVPKMPGLTFQQRIQQIFTNPPEQIVEGEIVEPQLIEEKADEVSSS